MIPSLPQKDSAHQQQQRKQELAQLQGEYVYDHGTRVQPLGVAQTVPSGQNFSFIWGLGVLNQALGITANLISISSRVFDFQDSSAPKHESLGAEAFSLAERAFVELKTHHLTLSHLFDRTHVLAGKASAQPQALAQPLPLAAGAPVPSFLGAATSASASSAASTASSLPAVAPAQPEALERLTVDLGSSLGELLKFLASKAFELLLHFVGLYGQASSLSSYQQQFQLLPVPPSASTALDDVMFARLRVAGPNPVVLRRIAALDARFPVTDAQFRSVMGEDDSLALAGKEGRLYLADYQVLEGMEPGTFPTRKYHSKPLALFAVPREGAADRLLRAVAIQCEQQPGPSNPIYTPKDGMGWEVAKLFVQVADGTWHEMISHLGLTHLLLEAFVMATSRQLAPEHPLNVLLSPHFQGTLAINNAAVVSLIAPEGFVDRLLAGSIQASTKLAVDAVLRFRFNQELFPRSLAARGVDDVKAFPDYPYRDDGLLVWEAIHRWVHDYLALYYGSDQDVAQDYELQNWLAELTSAQGGGLQDIGENGAIRTFNYLVDLVTMVIFTASAQHAAVNFPQSYIMGFTPALPLAAYAPLPAGALGTEDAGNKALLAYMPPLQQAFAQQVLMNLLGTLYYTRLGAYDRYSALGHFQDPRVKEPQQAFQRNLEEVESLIGKRNLRRIPYRSLLPSEIPQSINI